MADKIIFAVKQQKTRFKYNRASMHSVPILMPCPVPGRYIRADHVLRASTLSSACAEHRDQHVLYLEHVVVRLSIAHPRRGDLQISLISPAGTRSQLLARR